MESKKRKAWQVALLIMVAANLGSANALCYYTDIPNEARAAANQRFAQIQQKTGVSKDRYYAAEAEHNSATLDLRDKRAKHQALLEFQERINMLINGLRRWESSVERSDSERRQLLALDWQNGFAESVEAVKQASKSELTSALISVLDAYSAPAPIDKAKIEESLSAFVVSLTSADLTAAKTASQIARGILVKVYGHTAVESLKSEQILNAAIAREQAGAEAQAARQSEWNADITALTSAENQMNATPATRRMRDCLPNNPRFF